MDSLWRALAVLRWVAPALAVAGFVGAFVFFIVSLFTTLGDNDRYGKLSVPGEARLELDRGDVLLYYEERAGLPSDSTLSPPGDLRVSVRSLGTGDRLELERPGSRSSYHYGSLDGVSFARVDVPEDGRYGVVARGGEGRPFPDRAVTFGPDVDIASVASTSALILGGSLLSALLLLGIGIAARRRTARSPTPAPPSQPVQVRPAPPPPRPEVPPRPDPAEELRRLDELRKAGTLSEADYEARRAAVLERL